MKIEKASVIWGKLTVVTAPEVLRAAISRIGRVSVL